jgi:molybdopterin-guanine dinucleotide biosynthesis protein A
MMTRGAIILCGGQSSRMGRDKNWLPFGSNETILQRVARLVSEAVPAERIICVASADQQLPTLPAGIRVALDIEPRQGPLAGLLPGLNVLIGDADAVFASGCDAPLIIPAFVTSMFDRLGHHQIAAPHDGQRWHPLPAVYRTDICPHVESLLRSGERSLVALLNSVDTRRVPTAELKDVDPQLTSLIACNSPADYESALRLGGFR